MTVWTDWLTTGTDHCLDRIREVLMCRPDVSDLVTMFWNQSSKPTVNGTRILHNCVNWDALIESTADRSVGREEMDALENPNLRDLGRGGLVEDLP